MPASLDRMLLWQTQCCSLLQWRHHLLITDDLHMLKVLNDNSQCVDADANSNSQLSRETYLCRHKCGNAVVEWLHVLWLDTGEVVLVGKDVDHSWVPTGQQTQTCFTSLSAHAHFIEDILFQTWQWYSFSYFVITEHRLAMVMKNVPCWIQPTENFNIQPWQHLLQVQELISEYKSIISPPMHPLQTARPSWLQKLWSVYLCINFSSVFSRSRITLFFRLSNSMGPLALQKQKIPCQNNISKISAGLIGVFLVVVGGFFLAWKDLGRMFDRLFPDCAFFCYFVKWGLAQAH